MELLAAAIQIAKVGSDVPEQTGDMSAVQALVQALKMPHPQEKPDQELVATTTDPVPATTTSDPVPASIATSGSIIDKAGYEARLDEIEKQLKARKVSDIVVWGSRSRFSSQLWELASTAFDQQDEFYKTNYMRFNRTFQSSLVSTLDVVIGIVKCP